MLLRERSDLLNHRCRLVQGEEMPAILNHDEPGTRNFTCGLEPLWFSRPVSVSIDQQDWQPHTRISSVRLAPERHVSNELQERLVMAWALTHPEHFLGEGGRECLGICNASLQHSAFNQPVPEPHHGIAKDRNR